MSATFFIQRLQTFFFITPRFFTFFNIFFKFSSQRLLHLCFTCDYHVTCDHGLTPFRKMQKKSSKLNSQQQRQQ